MQVLSDHDVTMELNDAAMDDWKCPICLELLYKPCVNTCGHVFCFWYVIWHAVRFERRVQYRSAVCL